MKGSHMQTKQKIVDVRSYLVLVSFLDAFCRRDLSHNDIASISRIFDAMKENDQEVIIQILSANSGLVLFTPRGHSDHRSITRSVVSYLGY